MIGLVRTRARNRAPEFVASGATTGWPFARFGRLAAKESALPRQQGELGQKTAEIAVLTARLAALEAEMARLLRLAEKPQSR